MRKPQLSLKKRYTDVVKGMLSTIPAPGTGGRAMNVKSLAVSVSAMISRTFHASLAAIAASLLIGGCAATPRLAIAPGLLSENWSEPGPAQANERAPSVAELLQSAEIAELTERAFAANPNLLAAQARIDQAFSTLRIARGAALPLVSVSNGISATRVDRINPATGARNSAFDFTTSFAAIDASYSIDFGGGTAAGKRAAQDRVRAAQLDQHELALRLASDIARTYVQRSTLEARLALVDRNITATTRLYGRERGEGGVMLLRKQKAQAEIIERGLRLF